MVAHFYTFFLMSVVHMGSTVVLFIRFYKVVEIMFSESYGVLYSDTTDCIFQLQNVLNDPSVESQSIFFV